jgi:uncharacterized membrane protein YgdD (TMEM256/DUF423 family)
VLSSASETSNNQHHYFNEKMNQRTTILTGILMAGFGVAVGAFGAHGLKDILAKTGRADTFELAVRYQFYHAFALLVTGMLMSQYRSAAMRYAAVFFTAGILFFSGSLYVLSLSGIGMLGAVTPVGGVLFILGWIFLFLAVNKK